MENGSYEKARAAWKQHEFPVIVKPVEGKLKVRLPSRDIAWPFGVKPRQLSPKLVAAKDFWQVPRARFDELIPDFLKRWGAAYVIQYFTEQKKCAPPCRTAQGFDCECTCGGEFHGIDGPPGKWIDITDTFSVTRGETFLSCRLLRRRQI